MKRDRSVICIDPKGRTDCIIAARRRKRKVITFDPFSMLGLDPASPSFGNDCDALAKGMVVAKPGERDSYFTDSARQLVSGVIKKQLRKAGLL